MPRLHPLAATVLVATLSPLLAATTPATGHAAADPGLAAVVPGAMGSASQAVQTSEIPRHRVPLRNPSFESGTEPWRAEHGRLTATRSQRSSDGRRFGSIRWGHGRTTRAVHYTSGTAVGEAGDLVTATVQVAAGSRAARHDRVRLLAVEVVDGQPQSTSVGKVRRLRPGFRPIRVQWSLEHDGAELELRVVQRQVRRGERLLVDGATVSITPDQPTTEPTEPTVPTTPEPASTTSLGLLSIREGQAPHWGDTSRYRYVVGYGWEHRRVATVKAANPDTDMLLYLEAGATQLRTDCDRVVDPASFQAPRASWGIDFCWLRAHGHLDWILRDARGDYLEFTDYPGFLAMDMGNPEYAAQWTRNAAGAVRHFGFDGVWADDVNTVIGHGHATSYRRTATGLVEVENAQYGADTVDWVRRVSQQWDLLTSADDLTLAANVYAVAWEHPGAEQAVEIARHLDVYSREHQTQWLTGHQCDPYKAHEPNAINATMEFAEQIQATGAGYVAIDYGHDPVTARDRQVMAFGRSMFLMTWNGDPRGAYFYRPCGYVDAAEPEWTTEVGTPTGRRQVLRTETFLRPGDRWHSTGHVLRRDFTQGVVIQNQLPHSVTVQLGGSYRRPGGEVVTEVTLPGSSKATTDSTGRVTDEGLPGTAAILTRVG